MRAAVLLLLLVGCASAKPKPTSTSIRLATPKESQLLCRAQCDTMQKRKELRAGVTVDVCVKECLTPPPAPPEKVSEAELLRYKAAFLNFKSIEAEIVARYRIRAGSNEVFDPDTGEITRTKGGH